MVIAQIVESEWEAELGNYLSGGGIAASRQFGADQTDVFVIDGANQLTVYWVNGEGHWQGPLPIGPALNYVQGSLPAVSQQFGANQTDVFLFDGQGALNVLWVQGEGSWGGPQRISATGFKTFDGQAPSAGAPTVSQQIGANQTDVFAVDNNGQLNVFWVQGEGAWHGPVKIGPAGFAYPNSNLAASQQFGATQTDVFLVDAKGQLNVFWVQGEGAWQGPEKIGPTGFAYPGTNLVASQQFGANQTDVFLVDKTGQLNVFWVQGEGAWQGPEKIGGAHFPPGAALAVSQQFGANQTDVFLVDNTGQINIFWVQGEGAWQGPLKIGTTSQFAPGSQIAASQQFGAGNQTDIFLVDYQGNVNVCWVVGEGQWQGPTFVDPAMPGGFGSNYNYVLANLPNEADPSKGSPILGLSVTIEVTEDIVCASASGATGPAGSPPPANILGFGFQLNCYSPANETSAWQQYVIALFGGELTAAVDNWPVSGNNIINDFFGIAALPNKLPAGYSLTISLENDQNGNITGVTFGAFDNLGTTLYNQTTTLASIGAQIPQQIAPIIAFELDLVGPVNSESAVLSSGAATITYQAQSTLTPLTWVPPCAEVYNPVNQHATITAETANSFYSALPSDPATQFSQTFTVNTAKAMIRKVGKPRSMMIVPPEKLARYVEKDLAPT